MNVLVLGPRPRNTSIEQSLLAGGQQCVLTENSITPSLLAGIDWIVVNGYAPILKKAAIAQVGGKVVNIHPTFLPYGRGIFPLFWALFYGWPTGVSVHQIDEGIDTGPILARKQVDPSSPSETLRSFNQRLLEEANRLFIASWPTIFSGLTRPVAQEPVSASLVSKNRIQSEAFVELLPDLWETPLSVVRELGASFRGNLDFLAKTTIDPLSPTQ